MRKYIVFILAFVCILTLCSCGWNSQKVVADNIYSNSNETAIETRSAYTYEKLSQMPAEELLDLFIENGLVINDDLKASYTEEELRATFKEHFALWHTGVSAHSYTAYIDLAEQTKEIYDKITE